MFKPDLSDLGFIPVVATNPETASEFRSLFAGSFLAYGYLISALSYILLAPSLSLLTIAYIMGFIAFGRLVSFFYEGLNSFGLFVFFGEVFLAIVLVMIHRKRKNEIPYS